MSGKHTPGPKINPKERLVLDYIGETGGDLDWCAYSFAPIMKNTGLTRPEVRRACRSLARKGLTAFERALWTEDGEMVGAGYRATAAGRALATGEQAQ